MREPRRKLVRRMCEGSSAVNPPGSFLRQVLVNAAAARRSLAPPTDLRPSVVSHLKNSGRISAIDSGNCVFVLMKFGNVGDDLTIAVFQQLLKVITVPAL